MADASAQSKKRTREDIVNEQITNLQFQGFAQSSSESQQIEALMNQLKKRVLEGETLNSFKKEIAQISLLIDKNTNQQLFEKSVHYLAQILQRSEREINLMLRRNCLQDKKKRKKIEIDKQRSVISNLIERDLKDQNMQQLNAGITD